MDTTEEWTELHGAARLACGEALEGEASARMERRVRLVWEAMREDGAGMGDVDMYVQDAAPVSTFRVWSEFGEASGLRSRLAYRVEDCGQVIESVCELEDVMRAAYVDCIRNAVVRMPWAIREVAELHR